MLQQNIKSLPSQKVLLKMLKYEPNTGMLKRASTGLAAGARNLLRDGRIYVRINGKVYQASRLIWKLHYGVDPPGLIDHINCDVSDNRLVNLRVVTKSQNNANVIGRSQQSPYGRGVRFNPKRSLTPFSAIIGVNGKRKYLGNFATKEEAQQVFAVAAQKYYGNKYARGSHENER